MATAKTTTMRMTAEDLAILDAVQEQWGMVSRSEALRFVLRFYANEEKLKIAPFLAGGVKPKGKSKK